MRIKTFTKNAQVVLAFNFPALTQICAQAPLARRTFKAFMAPLNLSLSFHTMFVPVLLALLALSGCIKALVQRALATCSSTPVGPREANCLATTVNGAKFFLQCSTDYDGNVIGMEQIRLP
jgi:hypothetical protein